MNNFFKKALAVSISNAICFISLSANAASYEVIDYGTAETVERTLAQKQNDSGTTAILGSGYYDFAVQFDPYLTDTDLLGIVQYSATYYQSSSDLDFIEDISSLRLSDPTPNDLAWTIAYLQSKSSDYSYQKVGTYVGMLFDEGTSESQIINIFDEKFEGTSSYTRSTNDFINGVTNEGWIYGNGSAPYLPQEFTVNNSVVTYWVRDFIQRGFYSTDGGQTIISIVPEALDDSDKSQYGGTSSISDMNDNRIAVGFISTAIDDDARDYIESASHSTGCSNAASLLTVPFDVCVQTQVNNSADAIFHTEAYKWTLGSAGVLSSEPLGLLIEENNRDAFDTREFVSVASAINNQETAVGYATGWTDGVVTDPSASQGARLYAVAFKNDRVFDLHNDRTNYFNSKAHDINDNGIAVGEATTNVQGSLRTKFFYVDTNNTDDIEMIFPSDYFTSSSSTARAINNNGYIVGEGEVETISTDSGNPRRQNGFLYKIAEQRFINLNDLLPCDSDYSIVQARGINDANEITATAIVKETKRDVQGNVILDEDGEATIEDVIRAVKLKPLEGGEVETCEQTENTVTRNGANVSWLILLGLGVLLYRRKMSY